MKVRNKVSKGMFSFFLCLLCAGGVLGCNSPSDGPFEDAGEEVDRAVEDAGDALEDLGDEIERKTDK